MSNAAQTAHKAAGLNLFADAGRQLCLPILVDARVNPDIVIRPAIASDADAIAAIYLASRSTQHAFAPVAANELTVLRDGLQQGQARVAVSVDSVDDKPLGFCVVSRRESVSWIDELYLLPHLAGKGIGSLLLQHLLHGLTGPVSLYTFEANTGARRFYERHGFSATNLVGANPVCRCVLYELIQDIPARHAMPLDSRLSV